jgi:hypothetical protein
MSGYLSTAHYLLYWKISAEERRTLAESRRANYAAHNHLGRVKPGDVLWIANVYLGRLYLIGRLQVEVVVDDIDIAQELVGEYLGDWQEADWYAIANRYNVEPMREVELTPLVSALRFKSQHDRLYPLDGRVDANQLRSLRELTSESARLLEEAWYDDEYTPQDIQDYLELTEDDTAYAEGKQVTRTLRQRQRNRTLVADARHRYKQKHGRLCCQVCGFDFAAVYGIEYIEAHHKTQMARLEDETLNTVDDLAMLCANCHRMVHQRTPPYSIEELKALMQANRSNVS